MGRQYSGQDETIGLFLKTIKPLRHHVEKVYLFGSRCRDDWKPDSDYDILVVLERRDRAIIGYLYDAVMEVLLQTGNLVSLKIFSRSEFNRLTAIPTPFMENVLTEGALLG